ncbi:oxaloacetate tautomerase Fahd2a, mitochondrial isoform X2 [Maniola hyperantus]|uniref:oxaloacetate tautomerase Fahd2a, mitochondrial isoform X1 n=1 Tax=Aphantopus hyperantus TaxID=2795564 RepID=UPI001569F1F5|nr:fumarylacetoacetate hydrolase domain-containing protein 2 [Maniola hyperantus]XP_034837202.1 fumarylacetoacetate hydrolase domain-containing protein 2 [Maniola hyperantus]XP_034837203.1 fumarylacetoacetate hydrolase domain-containing protein 2 [Maniola hyperantus]XP_034837204.1 fumarylacetoacetate hydrolase domain-containing protein 2 [Maniola hyperantus]
MNNTIWARRAITCIKTHLPVKKVISTTSVRNFSVSSRRNMKLVQFVYKNHPSEIRAGILKGDSVVDINKADNKLPSTVLEILRNGDIEKVKRLQSTSAALVPLSSIDLAAPVHGNDKVLCVGLNYKDHCEEQKLTPPEVPMIFSKFSSSIVGPKDAVRLRTQVTDKVDWEVELTVVIGKEASNIKAADAFNYVVGYTIAQDISARNWQKAKNGGQFLLGKSMDTFCPLGPCITTSDEIGDPQDLEIKCSINGVLKQKSKTDQLVHKIPNIIERLTSVMTLLPGDIILTGTPGGVGMYRDPPEYLKPGDVIHSEIQNIGVLETRVQAF